MKYVNNITVYVTFLFTIKNIFDDYINLGLIDEHYGMFYFILLLVLISCQISNKKKMKNKNLYRFYYYSNIIVNRIFWGYFLVMAIYRFYK